ncbi:MAG: OsmC family protein [Microbacteriaceae bacterium]|nr:OsmC family protein [Microbacteriaceae bacterium]
MNGEHHYTVATQWQGNRGSGTSGYRDYGREHTISAVGKPAIAASSDRTFHGDADRWNPEELLIAALSQCHLLSYLHVAASGGVIVQSYVDSATGTMVQTPDGGGHFTSVTLRPRVTIARSTSQTDAEVIALAQRLHSDAAAKCFIAASVNFPVRHDAQIGFAGPE